MAQMWHYIIVFSHKSAKVTSDFILNYLKKVIGGATTQKNLKTNTKTLISSSQIEEYLKKSKNTGFFDIFSINSK